MNAPITILSFLPLLGGIVLLGLFSLAPAVPLLKRIDTWTASEAMHEVSYRMTREGRYSPVDGDAPELDLRANNGYWGQFEMDSRHVFKLQHGGLGLWQIDPRELDEKLRAYSREHRNRR